jgi:hypothetical protein
MINFIPMKLSLLKFKTNAYLRKNRAVRVSLPYKQSLNVGIIFSVEDKAKHDDVKDFVKHLERDGKHVSVISFLPRQKDNYEFMYDFFTDQDLSFWGNITSTPATRFAETAFDLLFYLDTVPNPLILNLVARSKAHCRVGKFWEKRESFFELMIQHEEGTRSLIREMLKYAQALK